MYLILFFKIRLCIYIYRYFGLYLITVACSIHSRTDLPTVYTTWRCYTNLLSSRLRSFVRLIGTSFTLTSICLKGLLHAVLVGPGCNCFLFPRKNLETVRSGPALTIDFSNDIQGCTVNPSNRS